MRSRTTPQTHPVAMGGSARHLWLLSHGIRLALSVLILLALRLVLSWGMVPHPPTWALLAALAALAAGFVADAGARRLLNLAWAEIPGATRACSSIQEATATAASWAPDAVMSVVRAAVLAAGGVMIAQPGSGPTDQAPGIVIGFLGALLLTVQTAELATALVKREITRRVHLTLRAIGFTAPLAWVIASNPQLLLPGWAFGTMGYFMVRILPDIFIASRARTPLLSTRSSARS